VVGDIPHRSSHCAAAVGCRHPCSCRHQKVGLHLPNTRLYLAYLRADHRRKYRIIKTTADDYCLQLVLKCIGSVINNIISNIDDTDIQREITNMFIRTNILIRKFHKCTVARQLMIWRFWLSDKTVRKFEQLPIYYQRQNCSPGILVSNKVGL